MSSKKIALLTAAVISIITSGCVATEQPTQNQNIPTAGPGPFGKYSEPITITSAMVAPPFVRYAEGESVDNNIWTRAYEDQLGIKIKYLWTAAGWGEPYDQKVNTALASDDLPDVMSLYTTLFMKAKDAGRIQDIKEAYEQYASERLKTLMSDMNEAAIKGSTFDGKMMGIGNPATLPAPIIAWIRADWFEQLNRDKPENINDILDIAKAFTQNEYGGKGTVGIAMSKDLTTINKFLNAYNVYPDKWVVANNSFAFGATQPDVKEPLRVLAELYLQNIVDQEFAIKATDVELKNDIIAGKVGIVIGGIDDVATAINDAYKKDGADWFPILVKTRDNIPSKNMYDPKISNFAVISTKCKYPEAAIKMINFQLETLDGKPEWVKDNGFHTTPEGYMAFFYPPVRITDPMFNLVTYRLVQNALSTNDTSQMNTQQIEYYNKLKAFEEGNAPDQWSTYKVWGPEGTFGIQQEYIENGSYVEGKAIVTETESWVQNGQNITSKMQEFFIKAIMNNDVDTEYENFVTYFNQQGGAEATEEVNQLNKQYITN